MCKVIAIANQKGGVGKTTTTSNLGIGLAKQGKKVLLIDSDAQDSLTASLGIQEPDRLEIALATIMAAIINDEEIKPEYGILRHEEGVEFMPGNIELSGLETSLVNVMSRETVLRTYIEQQKDRYDYILIDCMPSLGMITINAFTCADSILIPVQAAYLPVKGLEQLIITIGKVKRQINPKLEIEGILLTMVDNRTNYARDISNLLIENYGSRVLISSYLSEIYALEDKIVKYFPQQIAVKTELISALESDLATAQEHPKPTDDRFVGIEVKGAFCSEKAEGGQKIIDACQQMNSPDPITLGTYRGFGLELSFDTMERTYKVKIRGAASRTISLGTDPAGNITRIDNAIEKISDNLKAVKAELEGLEKQFEVDKEEVKKPFSKEQELKEKTDRLNVLNSLLNVDKRDNELADDAPDDGEEPPEKKPRDLER